MTQVARAERSLRVRLSPLTFIASMRGCGLSEWRRAHAAIGNPAYDALQPFRWGGGAFVDGRFPAPDGRGRLVAVHQAARAAPLKDSPFTLNTGRYSDQWHTMTRTGLSPRPPRHRAETLVENASRRCDALDLGKDNIACVATAQGESLFCLTVTDHQRRREIFVPIHWTDDPHSGQLGFKATPGRVEKVPCIRRSFL